MGSSQEEQQKLRAIILESITVSCKKSLSYNENMTIQGLIGITFDNQVFLVHLNENCPKAQEVMIHKGSNMDQSMTCSTNSLEGSHKSQRKRKRRKAGGNAVSHTSSNSKDSSSDSESNEPKNRELNAEIKMEIFSPQNCSNPGTAINNINQHVDTNVSLITVEEEEQARPTFYTQDSVSVKTDDNISSTSQKSPFQAAESSNSSTSHYGDTYAEPYMKHLTGRNLPQGADDSAASSDVLAPNYHDDSYLSRDVPTPPWMGSQIDRTQSQAAMSGWPANQSNNSNSSNSNQESPGKEPADHKQRTVGFLPIPLAALLGGEPSRATINRCHLCPRRVDRKTRKICTACNQHVCAGHSTYSLICDCCLPAL